MSEALPNVALMPSAFAPHLGGVEELSKRLARELRTRGSDTVVITNRYPRDLPVEEVIDGVPVHRERFRFPEPRPRHLAGWMIGTAKTRRGVRGVMEHHRSEVIHVQCVSTNGYYAVRAAHRLQLPLVVSMQGELTMDAAHIYQRSATMRRSWRRLVSAAQVVTGCSQYVIDEAVEMYGEGLIQKCRVVRNGIDVDAVRAAVPAPRPRPYLFALGRHVPQKGFDLLIDAFRDIASDYPSHDLVIAGDGPQRAALEERAHGARIEFVGAVPSEAAFRLYKGARGFVLPSRHEPQGIVVIEAMAAGVPVLATRVGGVPETVRDGVNGLLVEGGDASALATGLRQLLDDADGAKVRCAQAALDVDAYRWEHITDQYERCYANALARRRAPNE